MWLGPILSGTAALAAGLVAWRHQTRRMDRRTFYEPRGWDTSETEFRREVLSSRRRRRLGIAVASALAASVAATAIQQLMHFTM
jgi:hypothetical protein